MLLLGLALVSALSLHSHAIDDAVISIVYLSTLLRSTAFLPPMDITMPDTYGDKIH